MEIDGEFMINVDCQLDTGGHEDRIEALCLTLPQPLGDFVATAAQGFAQYVFTGLTGDHTGGRA